MAELDAYGLDPDLELGDVPVCGEAAGAQAHDFGPWVLNDFFAAREDRFCRTCGIMEMQWLDGSDG